MLVRFKALEGVCCHGDQICKQVFKCELLGEEQLGAANFFTAIKIDLRLSVFVNFTYVRNWQKKKTGSLKCNQRPKKGGKIVSPSYLKVFWPLKFQNC